MHGETKFDQVGGVAVEEGGAGVEEWWWGCCHCYSCCGCVSGANSNNTIQHSRQYVQIAREGIIVGVGSDEGDSGQEGGIGEGTKQGGFEFCHSGEEDAVEGGAE